MLLSIIQTATAVLLLFNFPTTASQENDPVAVAAHHATITPFPLQAGSRHERRQVNSGLRTCGYVGGVASLPLTCATGQCDFSTLPQNLRPLIGGCKSGSQNVYPTRCIEYATTSRASQTPGVLSCLSDAPHCQFYTWPELTAAAFACGTISASEAVFLTPGTSKASTITSLTVGTAQPTGGNTSLPTKSRGPLGLTVAQKVGIAVGSVCGGCIFAGALFFCCRRQRREMAQFRAASDGAANGSPARQSQEKPASTTTSVPGASPAAISPANTPTNNHLTRALTR